MMNTNRIKWMLFNTQILYFWSPILSTVHPLSERADSGLQHLNFHFRYLCLDHCLLKMKWESIRNWWCFIRSSTIANCSKSNSLMFLYNFPVRDNNNNVSKTVTSSEQDSHLNEDMCNKTITWTIHHSNFHMSRQLAFYFPVRELYRTLPLCCSLILERMATQNIRNHTKIIHRQNTKGKLLCLWEWWCPCL